MEHIGDATATLAAQTEPPDEFAIAGNIMFSYVVQKSPAAVNHAQQSLPRVEIVRVLLEMVREPVDSAGKQSNLYICGASIGITSLIVAYNRKFNCGI